MTSQPISRRQALGVLAAPLAASLVGCRTDRLFSPVSLAETTAGPITLIGAGDQHAMAANLSHKTGPMVKAVLDADPNAWAFALGDLVPNGTAEQYVNYHKAWGAFRERTCFVMGNHDRLRVPDGSAYYDYAGENAGSPGKGFYARTLGAWRCYFLNSEGDRDEQAAWLRADLPSWSRSHHIMAMWHSPMFASVCAHNGKTMTLGWKVGLWWQILQEHGAEFVVSGHVHRWERYPRMLRNGSASSQGIRQFIAGVGGIKNMDILRAHPLSESRVITRGVVRFDLHADRYQWKLTDLSGVVRDSGTQMCRKAVTVG